MCVFVVSFSIDRADRLTNEQTAFAAGKTRQIRTPQKVREGEFLKGRAPACEPLKREHVVCTGLATIWSCFSSEWVTQRGHLVYSELATIGPVLFRMGSFASLPSLSALVGCEVDHSCQNLRRIVCLTVAFIAQADKTNESTSQQRKNPSGLSPGRRCGTSTR